MSEVEEALNNYAQALGRLTGALKRADLLGDGGPDDPTSTLEYALAAANAVSLVLQSAIVDTE